MATLWQKLQQERHDLVSKGTAILDAAEKTTRELNKAEVKDLADIEARLADLAPQLEAIERQREIERNMASVDAPSSAPRTIGAPAAKGRLYADLFGQAQASGWESGEAFWAALHSGRADPRLLPATAGSGIVALNKEVTPSLGGFFVPDELVAAILDASLEAEVVRPRAQVHGMSSATKKIASFDGSTTAGGNIYGMSPMWLAEGGTISEDTASVRLIEMNAKKLALLPKASNELIADGQSFESQLEKAMIGGLAWGMDLAFLCGTGAGQPLGVLNGSCLITVAKETGQLADTIVYENLTKMFARLHPACVRNSVWVASPTAIPELVTMGVMVGVGGSVIPVMRENNGEFVILTRPVIFSEKMARLGDVGDILLADFSQYAIGLRKEISVDKSMHLGFAQDVSTYRAIVRVDGMPLWASVYTPYAGDTLSPFVTLAAR